VTASFRGQRVAIEIGDVTSGGMVRPTFSVAALAILPICSAASPIPRDVKSLALFDAVSLTRGWRARGKDLLQLDFAVRDVTGRMLGCRGMND
jgi:hypothetical protein